VRHDVVKGTACYSFHLSVMGQLSHSIELRALTETCIGVCGPKSQVIMAINGDRWDAFSSL